MPKAIFFLIIFSLSFCHAAPAHTNALIHEHSPYLKMHAHNPVDWYPYGKKAFAKAKREHKLIFMSIGFSTCHWCHVMEKESFENPEIAALLNRDYVAVKVDKEELPQVDTHYQHLFAKLQNRRNGWPLSIIMTPDGEVLYMTTYIPPEDKYGVEGMKTLLPKYAKLYREEKGKVAQILEANRQKIASHATKKVPVDDANISARYVAKMWKRFDKIYKGFDRRPRFPMANNLALLLDIYRLDGDRRAWQMVESTLDAMARGGIYDQVEGGFFRYATDQDWVVPHYEKMLYTNAQLIELYTRAYILTGKALYRKVVTESIAEYERHLSEKGLFFGATDADSNGEEGGYFTYRYGEVVPELKKRGFSDAQIEDLMDYFDIYEPGNFDYGKSNVHFNTGFDTPPEGVEQVRAVLKKLRQKRAFPFVDRKIMTGWNALMIKSLFVAGYIDDAYTKTAERSLAALLKRNDQNGTLYHYTIGTQPPAHRAMLEDYAFLTDALIAAYEATYDKAYLEKAAHYVREAKRRLYDGKEWYLAEGTPKVTTRYLDKYYTTPLSRMLSAMLSLAALEYDLDFFMEANKMLGLQKPKILAAFDQAPSGLRLLLRMRYGDIILKAKKERLLANRKRISEVRYPFLLTKAEQVDRYLLCDMQTCFANDRNLTKILKRVQRR